jgi:hypothetical protein
MTAEQRDDLRATAEAIVEDAEELKQIELRKLNLRPDEQAEEGTELAEQAEVLAEDISVKARVEKQLAEEIAEAD